MAQIADNDCLWWSLARETNREGRELQLECALPKGKLHRIDLNEFGSGWSLLKNGRCHWRIQHTTHTHNTEYTEHNKRKLAPTCYTMEVNGVTRRTLKHEQIIQLGTTRSERDKSYYVAHYPSRTKHRLDSIKKSNSEQHDQIALKPQYTWTIGEIDSCRRKMVISENRFQMNHTNEWLNEWMNQK